MRVALYLTNVKELLSRFQLCFQMLHFFCQLDMRGKVVLSCISVKLVNPVFAQTDAIGSGMRKKIKPITDPISLQLKTILGK